MNPILIRHGEPSKYDHCEYGTLCKVMITPTERYDLYKQVSKDESEPIWNLVGTFGPEDEIDELI